MTGKNADEAHSPSRRALLKAAAAGGAFAVPLIASFSMDTASAQTRAGTVSSSNMFCTNMASVPTAAFYARLQADQSGNPVGPVVGLAGIEFVHGRPEAFYEFLVKGTVSFFLLQTAEGMVDVANGGNVGVIKDSALTCGIGNPGGFPPGAAVAALYRGLAEGGTFFLVNLTDGSELTGSFVPLRLNDPHLSAFSRLGKH